MRAGELRHRITIQQTTQTRDAYGGIVDTWGTYKVRWAKVAPARAGGRETGAEHQLFAESMYEFTIRYLAGVTPKMRISWNGRTFDIVGVGTAKAAEKRTVITAREVG